MVVVVVEEEEEDEDEEEEGGMRLCAAKRAPGCHTAPLALQRPGREIACLDLVIAGQHLKGQGTAAGAGRQESESVSQ